MASIYRMQIFNKMQMILGKKENADETKDLLDYAKKLPYLIEDLDYEIGHAKLPSISLNGDKFANTHIYRSREKDTETVESEKIKSLKTRRRRIRKRQEGPEATVTFFSVISKNPKEILLELSSKITDSVIQAGNPVCHGCGKTAGNLRVDCLEFLNRSMSHLICEKEKCKNEAITAYEEWKMRFIKLIKNFSSHSLMNTDRLYVRVGKCNMKECYTLANERCQGCFSVYYCGRNCQKEDWTLHRQECKQKKLEKKKAKSS